MSLFFNWSEEEYSYLPTTAGYVLMVILLLVVFAVIFLLRKDNRQKMSAKELSFCAMAMALAMVTSFIKFASLPFGGSITLFSMFFIALIGYIYGLRVGIVTGMAYGLLQLVTGPYIYHPVQVLLDYPLAFGMLGLAGLFTAKRHGLIAGYALGALGRFLMHVISGYVFFASSAPEGMNPIIYSLGYNATYIFPEMVATVAILSIPAVSNSIRQIRKMAEPEDTPVASGNVAHT